MFELSVEGLENIVNINLGTGIALIIVLMMIKILLTLGYSSLVNARKALLRERHENGVKRAGRALKVSEDATPLIATHEFLAVLLNLTIAALIVLGLAPSIQDFIEPTGSGAAFAEVAAYIILLPLVAIFLIIFTERLPSAVIMRRPESFAILAAAPMAFLVNFLRPVIFVITQASQQMAGLLGVSGTIHFVTEEEIKTLVDAGSEGGILEDEEKEMIYSIFRFGDTVAREVMVPRIDIVALDIDTTLEKALETIITAGHSRIPVYHDTIDNIEGILYAKDLLAVWQRGEKPEKLATLIRKPHFVPESKKASELLIELQRQNIHMVFVVDEYGGTAGIVTLEDLVEEIVGEIRDEYDVNEEALYEEISEDEYIFNARIDLDDLNRLLDVSVPTEESDTLGGFIYSELGRVPNVDDEIIANQLQIKVLSVAGRRIQKVHVKKVVPAEAEAETGDAEAGESKEEKPSDSSSGKKTETRELPTVQNNNSSNSTASTASATS